MDRLDKHHGLRTRYLKALAATEARQSVVNANHIVTRLLIAHPLVFADTARRRRFLGAEQPADIVLGALAAVRAAKRRALGLLLLVEVVALSHWPLLYHDGLPAEQSFDGSQESVGLEWPRFISIGAL